MHKGNDCNQCIKLIVCKLVSQYNTKCNELQDTNTDNFVSVLNCKHYEKRVKK